jgi:hypothetical protein
VGIGAATAPRVGLSLILYKDHDSPAKSHGPLTAVHLEPGESMSILMVTGIEGARNCATFVAAQIGMDVEVAEGRKSALAALHRREHSVVVIDDSLAECDPAAADKIWERAGLAIPLQINFAITGAARLVREIRAALHRREREQALARRAAAEAVEAEWKEVITGLLLHSQLALSGGGIPAQTAERLRAVTDFAGDLRRELSAPVEARIRNVVAHIERRAATMAH